MKFSELIKTHTWAELEPVFLRLYPRRGSRVGFFGQMYGELQQMEPVDSKYSIAVTRNEAFCKSPNPNRPYRYYGLYATWEEWLGTDIQEDTLSDLSSAELICMCMKQMTRLGFTKETAQEARDEYLFSCEQVKKSKSYAGNFQSKNNNEEV
jgi:hypothetical protein